MIVWTINYQSDGWYKLALVGSNWIVKIFLTEFPSINDYRLVELVAKTKGYLRR